MNARSPDSMLLATRFELKLQDVIYVAISSLGAWNRVISQILPTVQTLYETKILVNLMIAGNVFRLSSSFPRKRESRVRSFRFRRRAPACAVATSTGTRRVLDG